MSKKILLLLFFIVVWLACQLLGSIVGGTISFFLDPVGSQVNFTDYMKIAFNAQIEPPYFQVYLIIVHFFSFVVPAIVLASLVWRDRAMEELGVKVLPRVKDLISLTLIIVCFLPFAAYLDNLLQNSNWLDWFPIQDQNTSELLSAIFGDKSLKTFILNFTLVAIMAGVGEEIFFRGFIQRVFQQFFKNGHLAVIVTGVIFGIFHFEVYGLVIRIVLGVILGYAFYYSGSIWLSILLHLLFNGYQVVIATYMSAESLEGAMLEGEDPPSLLLALFLLIPGIIIFYKFRKMSYG